MIDVGGMHLVLIFLCILWSTRVTDQTKDAVNYSCIESNITAKFRDSSQSYSARDYSSNCSLLQCSFSTNTSQIAVYRQQLALTIWVWITRDTVHLVFYSCCTPMHVSLPIFLMKFCSTIRDPYFTNTRAPTRIIDKYLLSSIC